MRACDCVCICPRDNVCAVRENEYNDHTFSLSYLSRSFEILDKETGLGGTPPLVCESSCVNSSTAVCEFVHIFVCVCEREIAKEIEKDSVCTDLYVRVWGGAWGIYIYVYIYI